MDYLLTFDIKVPVTVFDTCGPVPQTPQKDILCTKVSQYILEKKNNNKRKKKPDSLRRQHRVRQAAERNIFRSSVTKNIVLCLTVHAK